MSVGFLAGNEAVDTLEDRYAKNFELGHARFGRLDPAINLALEVGYKMRLNQQAILYFREVDAPHPTEDGFDVRKSGLNARKFFFASHTVLLPSHRITPGCPSVDDRRAAPG
jgi:hypothetical protein